MNFFSFLDIATIFNIFNTEFTLHYKREKPCNFVTCLKFIVEKSQKKCFNKMSLEFSHVWSLCTVQKKACLRIFSTDQVYDALKISLKKLNEHWGKKKQEFDQNSVSF